MTRLVTGAAGFIGFHFCVNQLQQGYQVIGIDNLNDYYDVSLKQARLEILNQYENFTFYQYDIADNAAIDSLFAKYNFERVINLAAQAGVRYSIENPLAYIESNCTGFMVILEACRKHDIKHLVYASSSSVYGANTRVPFSESDGVDHPVSIYAATKRYNELAAHTYANLYGLPSTGLRFFTVYGPWGRPDMAFFKFTRNIIEGKPIDVYNNGELSRDFTYIDDIVEGMSRVVEKVAVADESWQQENLNKPHKSYCPFAIYNIGNGTPMNLMDYIGAVEKCLNKKAELNMLPMQDGDVYTTCSDVTELQQAVAYTPATTVEQGMEKFVKWYRGYYQC